jgi:hypothetical protein
MTLATTLATTRPTAHYFVVANTWCMRRTDLRRQRLEQGHLQRLPAHRGAPAGPPCQPAVDQVGTEQANPDQ